MHSFILAEAAPATGDSQFHVVILVALGLTWVAMALQGVYFKRCLAKAATVVPSVAPVQPVALAPAPVVAVVPSVALAPAVSPASLVTDEIPAELVAVIAAAVQLTLRDAYRIQAIIPVSGHDWAHEGRRQIFASHQIR